MWQLALSASLILGATDVRVERLDGEVVVGRLLESSAGQLEVAVDGRKVSLPFDELLYVLPQRTDSSPGGSPGVWIELNDGSRVQAKGFVATQHRATLSLTTGQEIKLSTKGVRSVRMNRSDPGTDARWDQILQRAAQGDVVIIRKPNSSLDFLEGIVESVSEKGVMFRFENDTYDISRDRLEGIVYFHPAVETVAPPLCQLVDVEGNRWNARSIAVTEGSDTVNVETLSGAQLSIVLGRVRKIDFSGGNVVYLSDLDPESVQWTPFFPTRVAPEELTKMYWLRRDQSFNGGKLRLRVTGDTGDAGDTREFEKGLTLYSRTRLVYLLPGGFRRLTATAGIDDRSGKNGNVRLSIAGDGNPLLDVAVTGGDNPLPIDLDVSAVRRLSILVDFGDDLAIADQLDLCNARVTK